MAASSYKAVAIAQALLSDLNQRGPLTFTMGVASDGYPTLTTGSGSAGAQNIAIKVVNYLAQQNAAASGASKPLPYVDSLGLNANTFSPTVIQISLEQLAGNTGTLVIKGVNLAPVLASAAQTGAEVQMLLTTNTTAPTPGAGTLVSEFNPSVQYPGTGDN